MDKETPEDFRNLEGTKYYIRYEFCDYWGDRYWFLIFDNTGLYARYYVDDHRPLKDNSKFRKAYRLIDRDFHNNIKDSTEVTKEEWAEEIFLRSI